MLDIPATSRYAVYMEPLVSLGNCLTVSNAQVGTGKSWEKSGSPTHQNCDLDSSEVIRKKDISPGEKEVH